jgi:2-polyprenyl-3-methyl-5-hydroxy-6-metoxy-1,4-benzoquinol methylase
MRDKILTVGCLWNPDDFQKQYDAVLCADVMEHIPTQHVPTVLTNLRKSTRKAAYFSISVQADYFGPRFFGEPLHLTIRRPNWWFAQLTLAEFRVSGYVTANDQEGEEAQLHAFLTV